MHFTETIKELITRPRAAADTDAEQSKGAYWCDECNVRIRDVDLPGSLEADVEGSDSPACPECGDEMRFERSLGSSCAC